MTPAETITAAVAELNGLSHRVGTAYAERLDSISAALERLLPLAELSPEDLRYTAIEMDTDVFCMTPRRERVVAKLYSAADVLEGRGA